MTSVQLILYMILTVIVAYFGLANAIVHFINYFKFYRPFNEKLVKYDVYESPAFANTIKGRITGTVIVLLVTLGMTVYAAVVMLEPSHGVVIPAIFVALLFGLLLYGKKLRYELWNVQQFVKQYKNYLDKEKFTRFLRREYDISLEKLSDDRFVMQRLQNKGK